MIDALAQANAAREANRPDEAIALYRQVLKTSPANAEAWWYLGLLLYEKDKHTEAAQAFSKVAVQQPKQGAGWAMLGITEYRNGRYDQALAHLRKAHSLGVPPLNNLDKVARYHLVALLNRSGEHDLASGLLLMFVRDAAITPSVKKVAGIAALGMKVLPEEIKPEQREPITIAGEASMLAWQKRNPEARAEGTKLLARYPKLANVHYLMGYLLLLENDGNCVDYFKRELELDPEHVPARLQIAYELLRRGEAAAGLPYAEEAIQRAPANFVGRNIYGRILLDLDRADEAVRELEHAVKLAPGSAEAHFHLASAYNRAGRKQDAARHREIFSKLEQARSK
ncbi:MAG TPA: tetratricopeptide repeat protein [Bryobacteraceae bacterium]|nr:tetratricopeptide repeat protein [Bryobacteraceae bacterium]